jgi:hypothetical protein
VLAFLYLSHRPIHKAKKYLFKLTSQSQNKLLDSKKENRRVIGVQSVVLPKQEKDKTRNLIIISLRALIQIVIFAKIPFISVHPLQPTIDELMNARNRYEQYCHELSRKDSLVEVVLASAAGISGTRGISLVQCHIR